MQLKINFYFTVTIYFIIQFELYYWNVLFNFHDFLLRLPYCTDIIIVQYNKDVAKN